MPVLHLGVILLPYSDKEGVTTGDVAEILEAHYHVMEIFAHVHEADIATALETSYEGAIESILMGAPAHIDPAGAGASLIEESFKNYLLLGEMETLGIPGVPTQAALDRRSKRFKKGKAKKQRPSFIDTGLYESSFKAWMDGQ